MSAEQVLLTIAVTVLTTIVAILIAGGVVLLIIARKVKAQSLALRSRTGLPDNATGRSALAHVRKIAWLMDSSIPIGGGHRIGIDGLIDFVPGIGDRAGVLVLAYIINRAGSARAPQPRPTRTTGTC